MEHCRQELETLFAEVPKINLALIVWWSRFFLSPIVAETFCGMYPGTKVSLLTVAIIGVFRVDFFRGFKANPRDSDGRRRQFSGKLYQK